MKRWIKNIIILCVVCLIGVTAAIWVNVVNKEEVSGETIGINIVPVNSFVTEQDSEDNQSITDYRRATGFEALIGHLYLTGQYERLTELVSIGLESIEKEIKEKGAEHAGK